MPRVNFFIAVCFSVVILASILIIDSTDSEAEALVPTAYSTSVPIAEIPPWPFDPLTAEERQARLEFFLSKQSFEFDPTFNNSAPEQCARVLRSLSDPKHYTVLSPVHIGSRADSKIGSLVRQCPRLTIDRAWFSTERGPLVEGVDKEFDELPLSEKDGKADFFYRYEEDIELYVLSPLFDGEQVWATFAEPGVVMCNEGGKEPCEKLSGYRRYARVIVSAVFGYRRECGWNWGDAITGHLKVSCQAARSTG